MGLKESQYRKEIHLPKDVKKDLIKQALDEGFDSPKQMIEQRTIDSVRKYQTKTKE
jgi:hypothetical protein